jgi:hypothetical protein
MKRNFVLIAAACLFVLGGCTSTVPRSAENTECLGCIHTSIRNKANTECERRMGSDRERCLRNNRSSDEALQAKRASERASKHY